MFLNIPRELVIYSFNQNLNFFFILVSNIQGWGIIKINYNYILLKNNKLYLYNFLQYIKTYFYFLLNFFLNFYKNYFQYLRIYGMGNKIVKLNSNLIIKLGFSHRCLYLCSKDLRIEYINKQLLKIESRSLYHIKNFVYFFQNICKINAYKKKGIFVKGFIMKVKVSNKKSKV